MDFLSEKNFLQYSIMQNICKTMWSMRLDGKTPCVSAVFPYLCTARLHPASAKSFYRLWCVPKCSHAGTSYLMVSMFKRHSYKEHTINNSAMWKLTETQLNPKALLCFGRSGNYWAISRKYQECRIVQELGVYRWSVGIKVCRKAGLMDITVPAY